MSHFLIVHAQKTAREHEFTEIFGNQFLYYEKSDEKPNPDVWQCIMIGIPAEMTLDECRLFFEPYGNDIYHITVIHDSVMHGCKAAVIQFHLKESMESFCRLYCHLHFPAHSSAAPCLVVPLQDFVVIDDNSSPAVENSPSSANVMPTIPQETTAASIPSIPDDSSGSVLSPPPPAHLQLPNCPVCLRRISDKASGVCATQDVIVGPDFTGHADRCPVCFIVSEDGRDRRHCAVCGLKENLWVCLQCAYTGCGRYTSQHAKKHFHDKGHPFSLECATGRLWDYVHDKFVHLDPFTIYTKNIASREMLETSSITSQQAYPEPSPLVLQSSGPVCSASLEDNGEKEATWTLEKPIAEDMSQDEIIKSHLDNGVVDKIGKLQQDYEQLLVSQLNDQRLHYEKLLARETVRLLEMGYDVKGVFKEASSDSVYIERADAAMIPCPGASGESKVAIDENMSMDGSLDSDMAQIEQLKMDISAIEHEYNGILQQIHSVTASTVEVRKDNNRLLNAQKVQKQRIADYTAKTETIRQKEKDEVANLEQQIRELEFYLRTQEQIGASPLRDEVQGGVMIVQEGQPTNRTNSRVSASTRRKKGGHSK